MGNRSRWRCTHSWRRRMTMRPMTTARASTWHCVARRRTDGLMRAALPFLSSNKRWFRDRDASATIYDARRWSWALLAGEIGLRGLEGLVCGHGAASCVFILTLRNDQAVNPSCAASIRCIHSPNYTRLSSSRYKPKTGQSVWTNPSDSGVSGCVYFFPSFFFLFFAFSFSLAQHCPA
jgi:hypothetical protein